MPNTRDLDVLSVRTIYRVWVKGLGQARKPAMDQEGLSINHALANAFFLGLENDPDSCMQDFGDASQGGKRVAFVTG